MPDVAAKFIYRKGTAAEWTAANPVLANGEPAYVTDTRVFKIGDGVTAFNSLTSYPNATAMNAAVATANTASTNATNALTTANSANSTAAAANATANAALAAVTGSAVGSIVFFAGYAAPGGFVKANGATLSRATYSALWNYAASSGSIYSEASKVANGEWGRWGTGNGTTTFSLPDFRGITLMPWDDGRGWDTGREVLQFQDQMVLAHAHGLSQTPHGHGVSDPGHTHGISQTPHSHAITDPGHSHGAGVFRSGLGGAAFSVETLPSPDLHTTGNVDGSGTGISIAAANASIAVQGASAGLTVQTANANLSVQSAGGSRNRVQSIAVLACIKY